MSQVPAIVIAGPGTNRDRDVQRALELAGAAVRVVLANELVERPALLDEARLAVVAGGFSYADSLGAGRMLALDLVVGLGDGLRRFVEAGRPVIGICNGFQVLTRTRLLPGALGHNAQGRFDCRWVVLDPVHPQRPLVDPEVSCRSTSASTTSRPGLRIIKRSTRLCNSRTLPGKSCRPRRVTAAAPMVRPRR